MHLRYGESYCSDFQIARFDEKIKINDVTVQILPAGHILGSIQFLINYNGYRLLISGDYKRTFDLTCKTYEPIKCNTFITEATFGLPIFNHPDDKEEAKKLGSGWNPNVVRPSISLVFIAVYLPMFTR